MINKIRGSITIFLGLVFTVILSLIMALFQSALVATKKSYSRSFGYAAVGSMFAEYNIKLYEKFGICFLDGGYGNEYSESKLTERFTHYCAMNTDSLIGTPMLQDVKITGIEFITDNNCYPYKRAACKMLESKYGVSYLKSLNSTWSLRRIENNSKLWEDTSKSNSDELDQIYSTKTENNTDQNSDCRSAGPLNEISKYKQMDILNLVMPGQNISVKTLGKTDLVSARTLNKGYGNSKFSMSYSDTVLNAGFSEYLLETFTNATSDNFDDNELNYEIEYIVAGGNCDRDNLKSVVNKLLLIREGINFAYILASPAKQAQVLEMATTLTGALGNPILTSAAQVALELGWAYAESIADLRELLKGYKVRLVKNERSWKVPITGISSISYQSHGDDIGGINYKDYLGLLLLLQDSNKTALRSLDLIENVVRNCKGEQNFKASNLISGIIYETTWNVSEYKYTFPVYYKYN